VATPNTNAWRYRVGDYRVICDLADEQMVVYVIRPLRQGIGARCTAEPAVLAGAAWFTLSRKDRQSTHRD
jgi:hypothetical protein